MAVCISTASLKNRMSMSYESMSLTCQLQRYGWTHDGASKAILSIFVCLLIITSLEATRIA
jgi:hypothetical protein